MLSGLWRELEPDLRRTLRRWIPPTDVDDAVQEVFIRLERRLRRAPLDASGIRDLARLAATNLGKNAARDSAKRAQAMERAIRLEGAEEPAVASAEAAVGARMDLDRVLHAIAQLSDADRQAIARTLAPVQAQTKRERDRLSLQVLRARRRLRTKLSGMLAASPVWRLRPWHSDLVSVVGSTGAAVVVAAALGVLARTPPVDMASPAGHPVSAEPSDVTSATRGTSEPPRRASPTDVRPVLDSDRQTPSEHTPMQRQLVAVPHPAGGDAATVHGSDRGERPDLACVGGGPLGALVACVPHPLR